MLWMLNMFHMWINATRLGLHNEKNIDVRRGLDCSQHKETTVMREVSFIFVLDEVFCYTHFHNKRQQKSNIQCTSNNKQIVDRK